MIVFKIGDNVKFSGIGHDVVNNNLEIFWDADNESYCLVVSADNLDGDAIDFILTGSNKSFSGEK